jgi:hypothetical protein
MLLASLGGAALRVGSPSRSSVAVSLPKRTSASYTFGAV